MGNTDSSNTYCDTNNDINKSIGDTSDSYLAIL